MNAPSRPRGGVRCDLARDVAIELEEIAKRHDLAARGYENSCMAPDSAQREAARERLAADMLRSVVVAIRKCNVRE